MGSLQVFPLDVTGVKYPFKNHQTIIGRPISATDSTKHQAFQAKFNPDIPQITSRFEFHVKTLYSQRNCITAVCLNVKSTKIRNVPKIIATTLKYICGARYFLVDGQVAS